MSSTRHEPRMRSGTAAKRKEILQAALDIFGSKGYKGGSLVEIAERVGMTHAGILHHFGSKDQLLLEVLQFRDDTDVEHLDGQHIPDGMDLFHHLVRTAFLNARRAGIVQAYAVLSAESVTDDNPGRAFFQDRYRTLRGQVADAFATVCAQRGITTPDTVEHASAAILAVMDGLQVQWLLDPDQVALGEASAFAIEAIVSAVLAPAESPLGEADANRSLDPNRG